MDAKPNAALVITHRILSEYEEKILKNGVLYRPKNVVIGMGCNRGASAKEIEQVIKETLDDLQIR